MQRNENQINSGRIFHETPRLKRGCFADDDDDDDK
jgi:hypothetical protein